MGPELRWRDEGEDEGTEGSPTLCDELDDLCRLNERTIMALRPELLDALDAMMEDLLGVPDVKAYAMSDVVNVVVPIYGYESIRSALKVLPPVPLPGPEAHLGSLLVGLVADLALKYRQRIRDWLHKLSPGKFLQESLSVKVRG